MGLTHQYDEGSMKSLSMNNKKIQILSFLFIVFSLSTVSCSRDNHEHPKLTTGKQFFDKHCTRCHKTDGSGNFMKGIPANVYTQKDDRDIMLHIRRENPPMFGISYFSTMPSFKTMPDDEAKKIAKYLLNLKFTD
jgi:cytochrome c553